MRSTHIRHVFDFKSKTAESKSGRRSGGAALLSVERMNLQQNSESVKDAENNTAILLWEC